MKAPPSGGAFLWADLFRKLLIFNDLRGPNPHKPLINNDLGKNIYLNFI